MKEQLNCKIRKYFLQLQEKFIKNKITIVEFCHAFYKRDVLNSEVVDMLKSSFILLSPHKKSLDFSKLTYKILKAYCGYDSDLESLEIREREKKEF